MNDTHDPGEPREPEPRLGPMPGQTFNPQPYGSVPPPWAGQPAPGLHEPGVYPQHGAYAGYAPGPAPFPGSIVTLLTVSVLLALATGIIGIPSAVLASIAWSRHTRDPVAAVRRTTTGWVVLAVNFAVGVPLLVTFFIWAANHP